MRTGISSSIVRAASRSRSWAIASTISLTGHSGPGGEPRPGDAHGEGTARAQLDELAGRVRLGQRSLAADRAAEQLEGGLGVQPVELDDAGRRAPPGRQAAVGSSRPPRLGRRGQQRRDLRGGQRVVEQDQHPLVDHERAVQAGQLREVGRYLAGVDAKRPQEPPEHLARARRSVWRVPVQVREEHAVRKVAADACPQFTASAALADAGLPGDAG